MRNPNSKNPHQCSIYVWPDEWAAIGEIALRKRTTRSALIRELIQREKEQILGKRWRPEQKP